MTELEKVTVERDTAIELLDREIAKVQKLYDLESM